MSSNECLQCISKIMKITWDKSFKNVLKQLIISVKTFCLFPDFDIFNMPSIVSLDCIALCVFSLHAHTHAFTATSQTYAHIVRPVPCPSSATAKGNTHTCTCSHTAKHTHAQAHTPTHAHQSPTPNLNNDPSYESTSSSGPHQSLCCGKTDPRIGC